MCSASENSMWSTGPVSERFCPLASRVLRRWGRLGLIVYLAAGPGTSLTFHYVWPTSLTSQFIISCLCCLRWNLGRCLYKLFTFVFHLRVILQALVLKPTMSNNPGFCGICGNEKLKYGLVVCYITVLYQMCWIKTKYC